MAGELDNPQIPQQAQNLIDQGQQAAGDLQQDFGELRETLSRDSMTLAQAAKQAARPGTGQQVADADGLDWAVRNVPGARYPLALGYGAAYTVPGVINSGLHALTNPIETAGKWGVGVGFGVVMRTVLPKTGAGRAIAGTIMLGWFVKDALTPIASGMVDAHHAQGIGDIEKAGAKMGDGMGAFIVDSAIGVHGGIIGEKWAGGALKGTRLSKILSSDKTVAVAETVGLPKLVGKERFHSAVETLKTDGLTSLNLPALMNRPGFATAAERVGMGKVFGKERFEAWKSATDRWEHFEKGKEAAYQSDGNIVGRNLNRLQTAADRMSEAWAQKMGRPATPEAKPVTMDEFIQMIKSREDLYMAMLDVHKISKLGLLDAEGKPHGYTRTLELLDRGVEPASLKVTDPIPAGKRVSDGTSVESTLAGVRQTVNEIGRVETNRLLETEIVAATERAAAQAGLTEAQALALKEINASVVRKISDSTDAALNATTAEQRQIDDVVSAWMEIIHVANNQKHNPLDPGYKIARDQAEAIIKQVQTVDHLKQVAGLLSRFADASRQHMAADLGPNQRLVQVYNMLAKEVHTNLKQQLRNAGVDPDAVLMNKNPALVSIREDGGVGPHTMREIDGVFDVDHVFYPSNMKDLRARTMGTWWHEFWHDQYGGLAKLPELSRSQFLDDVVTRGLGDRANVMVDVPGHGKQSLKEVIIQILRAQADENTADIGGAGYGGQNTGVQLMDYLLAVRRDPNNPSLKPELANRSVMGERFADPQENPWGIEYHAHDVVRPLIVAAVMEHQAKASLKAGKNPQIAERILAEAQAIRQTARDLGPKSDELVWLNMDKPGEALKIKRSDMESVIPALIEAYMKAELKGPNNEKFTFGQLLPDMVDTYGRMHKLSEMMVEGITAGKAPSSYVIDKSVYQLQDVMGAGQPTIQKLVARGMNADEANAAILRYSDDWSGRFIQNNPHVEPIVTPVARRLTTKPIQTLRELTGIAISQQPNVRGWSDRHAVHIGGATGSLLVGDVFDLRTKLRTRLLPQEMSAMEQVRQEMSQQGR